MQDFSNLNKRNEEPFFQLYMGKKEAALKGFAKDLERLGGIDPSLLDLSIDSLLPVWRAIRPYMKDAESHPLEQMPIWYSPEVKDYPWGRKPISKETVRLLDGLAYYLGDVLVHNFNEASWQIGKTVRRKTFHSHKPIVSSPYYSHYPLNLALVMFGRQVDGDCSDTELRDTILYRKKEAADYEAHFKAEAVKKSAPQPK